MKKLRDGIVDFRKRVLPSCREKFVELAKQQKPDVLFFTCSDSRVAPNWFASTDPGDLFVVRNVGNLVPPAHQDLDPDACESSALAAVEFSINILRVSHIVVCGHSDCGAMDYIYSGEKIDSEPHLKSWLKYGVPALESLKSGVTLNAALSPTNQLSQLNVLQQIEHLKTHSFIRERVKDGQLEIYGWWFDIASAEIHSYEAAQKQFKLIE